MSNDQQKRLLELRKFASSRISAKLPIAVNHPIQARYQSLNVSHHGMLIQGTEALSMGAVIKLKTALPPHKKIVPITARVVRVNHENNLHSMGIQFLEIDSQAYMYWLEYIYKIEMMDTQDSDASATKMILNERKKQGCNTRKILVSFDTQEQAKQFVLEKIRDHKIFLNISTLKIPGDNLILAFSIVDQYKDLQIKTKILSSDDASFQPDWAVLGLPLQINESEDDIRIKLNHFAD
ncbi:MAG TPA: PilZ domain-containing protein [Oligoflexia bacterium]|nr:PilZ domain-containing protein [Oligoflexia bacterium]HMR25528.1 PilZ domain-containing protein [Oligoflexia bacterium]